LGHCFFRVEMQYVRRARRPTMNLLQNVLHRFIAWYVESLPAHRGKWNIIQTLLTLSGLDRAVDRRVVACREGCLFDLDLRSYIDRKVFYQGGHEKWDTTLVQSVVQPGWTVVDVGANIGWYSMIAAQRAGAGGRVFSFEISAPEAERLRNSARLNNFSQAEVVFTALSDHTGEIGITATRDAGMTSIASSDGEQATKVAVTTLDEFCASRGIAPVNFIKCDIEGAEAGFLRGAEATLNCCRPIILIEINPSALAKFGSTPDEVLAFLRSHGYALFSTGRAGITPLGPLPPGLDFVNAVAIHGDIAPRAALNWNGIKRLFANA
jgi:FkbM family methyltransferase